MTTLKHRRTPWDRKEASLSYLLPAAQPEAQETAGLLVPARKDFFCLHGLYVFDPERSTSADFRQFLWAGLRVLRAEAQARDLSREEVSQLLVRVFDKVHDAADRLWATLRDIVTKARKEGSNQLALAQGERLVLGGSERATPGAKALKNSNLSAAAPAPTESPEQAELRRLSILLEEQAAYNRACHDEDVRELLND